ncbi:MAG: hypothetical protein CR978_01165 [Gammaproteobacteria bacterium]|nr:MAG: hypothetical protein CR978_01165 [Gammaproteobacteria bacterium]PIE37529.1 MAG: hypothetical protein CSA53_05805 [Gammaproteobacteria bacterium]
MMNYYQMISGNFHRTIEALSLSVDAMAPSLEQACERITEALLADKKILCCGNGPGAAVCALLGSYLSHQFVNDRPALPLLNLCADGTVMSSLTGSDDDFRSYYARRIKALGLAGDVLIVAGDHSGAANLIHAIRAAQENQLTVIVLCGADNIALLNSLGHNDIHLVTTGDNNARITELQVMCINCLCELIDARLFGAFPPDPFTQQDAYPL